MKRFVFSSILALYGLSATSIASAQTVMEPKTVTASKAAEIRAENVGSAKVIGNLATGALVEIVKSDGGWVLIKYSNGSNGTSALGWVRANALNWKIDPSVASTLSSGREVAGNTALTLGVRSLQPRYNRHALIVGVSKYEDKSIPELAGVKYDRESATLMAQYMQVPTENIQYLQDEQATGNAIENAIKSLTKKVGDGDRVFIHFSGHGTRYYDANANGCVEGFMAYNKGWEGVISNRKMASLLEGITKKTDKLFVMYDACHSGGVAKAANLHRTRSLDAGSAGEQLRPKYFSTTEECSRPVNAKTRNLLVEAVSQGALPEDIIHLSSARDNEISFDDADKGGLATQYVRDCMLRDAVDLDHSGAITMDEIRQCAQEKIDKRMSLYSNYLPNHMVLSGNQNFIPAWFSNVNELLKVNTEVTSNPVSQPAPVQPVKENKPVETPPPAPTPQLTGEQALQQLFSQRDAKRKVSVSISKGALTIGKDTLDFAVKSDRKGYVYVALAGSDNSSVYLLFPNDIDANNKIEAGQTMELPRASWRVRASGPVGTDNLLVMVTDAPRDLSALDASKAGPFMMSLNNQEGRAKLGALMSSSLAGGSASCRPSSPAHKSSVCSDAFGANLLSVEEIQ